jgi:hypothetical protein
MESSARGVRSFDLKWLAELDQTASAESPIPLNARQCPLSRLGSVTETGARGLLAGGPC